MAESGSPATAVDGAGDEATSAWRSVLDQLESELGTAAREADAATRGESIHAADAWRAPAAPGPLPAELADRARALLAGQRELMTELEETRLRVARRLSALRAVSSNRGQGQRRPSQPASVYLDVTG